MLYKKGDWFSFAKRRAYSPRNPDASIDDPRPAAGSFSMADVRRLSAHVIKMRDMPEGVLFLSRLSRVWKSRVCDLILRGANRTVMCIHDFLCLPKWTVAEVQEEPHLNIRPTLQRFLFYCTPPYVADAVISDPTPKDLVVGTPSAKILAKAESSQKRMASISGATSIHVAKRTRFASAQSSGSTTRPSLFVGDSDDESDGDDDDACVEILLVTPLRSAAGKGIMADDDAAPSVGVSRPRPSSDGVVGNREFTREEWDAPYRPTFGVLTKEVFKDPAVCKTVVDQFPTPKEMSHHEYVQLADSRLKGDEEKVAGAAGLELQATVLEAEKEEEILHLKTTPMEFASFFRGQF
nr:hypothetical protein [Tanacetum cinerariifolium]